MNEETFLAALHESPGDELTWLALADWLDEDGQSQRARLVRLHRQLRRVGWFDPARRALEDELIGLLAAGARPVAAEVTNSIGMRLALIPPGAFVMGSPEGEQSRWNDEPQHEVELTRPFYLGVFLVTQEEYRRVTGSNPSGFSPEGDSAEAVEGLDTSRFPVENVTYDDAVAFCAGLGNLPEERSARRSYRLPTEAEWEYACRAGVISTAFHFGETIGPGQANHADGGEIHDRTTPVGAYPPNAFGLYDVHGNLDEWCADWFGEHYYAECPRQDPPGPTPPVAYNRKVIRGGTWDDQAEYLRCAFRNSVNAATPGWDTGFRVVCEWPVGPAVSRSRPAGRRSHQ